MGLAERRAEEGVRPDVDKDFSQGENLADKHPEKVKELEALFWAEAKKYNVLPLDWRVVERLHAELQGRPSLAGKRGKFVYYPGQIALPDGGAPPVLNKSFSITADLDIPEKGAEGMVYTHGGLTGGLGIYLRDGKAHFVYNMLAVERFTITSDPLPKGKVALAVNVAYEDKPGELGKPLAVTITANGKKVGEGKLPRTIPLAISRRGRRCRHGHRVGRGLHLQAAVRVHRQSREGDGGGEVMATG